MRDVIEQFRDAIRAAGLTPPDTIIDDGTLRRVATNGKRGDDAGWYVLHANGIAAGCFGDWRTDFTQTWRADIGRTLTPAEESAQRAKADAMRKQREADEAEAQERTAKKAAAIVRASEPAPEDHPYLARRGVKPHGARVQDGLLVIPMRDTGGKLWNVERIEPVRPASGTDKKGLYRGRRTGCYFSIGSIEGAVALCIVEGFATGATINEASGYPVAVAFNAGNLLPVAKALREKFPELPLILCADDDYRSEGNPGLTKATAAARAVGGLLAIPDFGVDRPEGATDFNDLAQHRGHEAVERAIANARAPEVSEAQSGAEKATAVHSDGWPAPSPLAVKIAPEPYPLDALPATIRDAVEEVQGFTKAPVALVASSALSAVSVAIQAHFDVQRADKLQGPVGLFLLSIADSGERKSTCDGFFSSAIRDYQAQQGEAAKPTSAAYRADVDAWKAKHDALTGVIRNKATKGEPTDRKEQELRDLEADKPEPPREPKLLRGDDTPENLAWALMHEWPSGGVLSAEAGSILGAHGMRSDSIMRNLALLNILWDGGALAIGRRTSESFTVRGARLTLGLQVQEATLRAFIHQSGGLARGTGFLARCLVAWPESTQGYRQFTEAPSNWPALASFNRRIAALLEQPVPIGEDGTLSPALLTLTPEAKAAWIAFHDAIEIDLRSGGELYDVRDVASKTADNAVRLAALFHVFSSRSSNCSSSNISEADFEGASRIAAWHLNEARRFFGELALPTELANAARLDAWLLDYCRREHTTFVPRRTVQQSGPSRLRDKAVIDAAVRGLDELGRAQLVHDGRRKDIRVNPTLLEGSAT